jgi:hypothetical protein
VSDLDPSLPESPPVIDPDAPIEEDEDEDTDDDD